MAKEYTFTVSHEALPYELVRNGLYVGRYYIAHNIISRICRMPLVTQ